MKINSLNEETLAQIKDLLAEDQRGKLRDFLAQLYPVDIADLFTQLELEEALLIMSCVDAQARAQIVKELQGEILLNFLDGYTVSEIATLFIEEMDSDDAADILNLLPKHQSKEVIASIKDRDFAGKVITLLRYPEDSAGGLMASEMITVETNWTLAQCVDEIRKQAMEVNKVFTVYAVDENKVLKGLVSLKKIILAPSNQLVSEIMEQDYLAISVYAEGEEVAQLMRKYDLITLPVIDALGRLVGRITIDDVVDFIQEEADKDYQMLSGISSQVSNQDSVWRLSKARLPWLIIGLFGGLASAWVIGGFEESINKNVQLAMFMPLIMAMGGNAGVQSSAIVVQGLANKSMASSDLLKRVLKELSVSLLNGTLTSLIVIALGLMISNYAITAVVALSLILVIVLASFIGTVIPLILDKLDIDPALATGPFITTTNDLLGLFLYFLIGNLILG